MTDRPRVPAVGGERAVPDPDPIARDYLLLALRLGQHIHGLVDGYFGPADLKAQVDMEQQRAPGRLADDAAALRERVESQVDDRPAGRGSTASSSRSRPRPARSPATRCPYLDHVRAASTYAAPVRRDEAFPGGSRAARRARPRLRRVG